MGRFQLSSWNPFGDPGSISPIYRRYKVVILVLYRSLCLLFILRVVSLLLHLFSYHNACRWTSVITHIPCEAGTTSEEPLVVNVTLFTADQTFSSPGPIDFFSECDVPKYSEISLVAGYADNEDVVAREVGRAMGFG